MSKHYKSEAFADAGIIELLAGERAKALSYREWKHRIAGYGYGVKDTARGQVVTTWPSGQEICALPAELSA